MAFITDYLFSLFGFGIHVFVFNELWDYILKDKLEKWKLFTKEQLPEIYHKGLEQINL